MRLVAVVAVERRPDLAALTEGAEQVEEDGRPTAVPWRRLVERLRQQRRASALLRELRVVRDVQLAREHPLALATSVASAGVRSHDRTINPSEGVSGYITL